MRGWGWVQIILEVEVFEGEGMGRVKSGGIGAIDLSGEVWVRMKVKYLQFGSLGNSKL